MSQANTFFKTWWESEEGVSPSCLLIVPSLDMLQTVIWLLNQTIYFHTSTWEKRKMHGSTFCWCFAKSAVKKGKPRLSTGAQPMWSVPSSHRGWDWSKDEAGTVVSILPRKWLPLMGEAQTKSEHTGSLFFLLTAHQPGFSNLIQRDVIEYAVTPPSYKWDLKTSQIFQSKDVWHFALVWRCYQWFTRFP